MARIPLLAGSRVAILNAPDDVIRLRPRPPRDPVADVAAAVRDALRFPLAGRPLGELARAGARATIVVEPRELPLPGVVADPRREALAGAIGELERLGVPTERQTVLVAGGLSQRVGQRELDELLAPVVARRFRGRVESHDAESPELVLIGDLGPTPLRVSRRLVEADVVVVVSAAETVLHGGPATLLGACGAEALRAAGTYSLLETAASRGWALALEVERLLSQRVPLIGASLVLNPPRLTGAFRGYPHEPGAEERIVDSPLRRVFGALPRSGRRRVLRELSRELTAVAAFGGPPSVAHVEALLRAVDQRAVALDAPLDAVVIGIPWTTVHRPREHPNPLTVAAAGLGLALRLWRDAFPVVDGGTAVLLHGFTRTFAHPSQQPYHAFFQSLRDGLDPQAIAGAERTLAREPAAIRAYQDGRACHPLQPFADWADCGPALGRLGAVVIAGCRDAQAARAFGFVPTHGPAAGLAMAYGRAGTDARIGVLTAPPYFPLVVGSV